MRHAANGAPARRTSRDDDRVRRFVVMRFIIDIPPAPQLSSFVIAGGVRAATDLTVSENSRASVSAKTSLSVSVPWTYTLTLDAVTTLGAGLRPLLGRGDGTCKATGPGERRPRLRRLRRCRRSGGGEGGWRGRLATQHTRRRHRALRHRGARHVALGQPIRRGASRGQPERRARMVARDSA